MFPVTLSPATAPLWDLYAPIEADLCQVTRIFDDELRGECDFVNRLCDRVRAYRGKMLRPALLLLCGRACGRVGPAHHTLAAVVEMVHVATLVHDDVLDQAELRRRQRTVNAEAGNVSAVLLGDYLISHAYHLCSSLDSQYASRRIAAATNVVCEGELMQNHLRGCADLSEAQYLSIIDRKTAALTAVACELGAQMAGAEPATVQAMQRYGRSAGMAFQIVDDVLDVTGTDERMGKSLGRDFDLGKPTLPLIHFLRKADRLEREWMLQAMQPGPHGERLGARRELRRRLESAGSVEYALDAAHDCVAAALSALESVPASDARASLTAMAEFIMQRDI